METLKRLLYLLLGIMAVSAFAQPTPHPQKMQPLSNMVGQWSGSGWMMTPERQRVEFTQRETIRFELDSTILHIRGEGFNAEGKQIHNALGIMFYDPVKKMYQMEAFLATGQRTLADMQLTEKGLNWSFKTEQGAAIFYEITLTESTWVEKGFYSPDGTNRFPFIEFTLNKISK